MDGRGRIQTRVCLIPAPERFPAPQVDMSMTWGHGVVEGGESLVRVRGGEGFCNKSEAFSSCASLVKDSCLRFSLLLEFVSAYL